MPQPAVDTQIKTWDEIKTTTCYMCACRCGIKVYLKDGTVNLDWQALARPKQTVVFYMGIGAAEEICRQMINHGLPSMTPAAVIRNGTQSDQKTLLATLGTLPSRIAESAIKPPALIVVGSVVGLHDKLSWFEKP